MDKINICLCDTKIIETYLIYVIFKNRGALHHNWIAIGKILV